MRTGARLVVSLIVGASLGAAERHYVGPRAVGMGGAVVASARPEQAQAYNAAVLGFLDAEGDDGAPAAWTQAPRFDWGLAFGAGVQLRGDL